MDRQNVYCGRRTSQTAGAGQVWKNGKVFGHEKSLKVRNHSPDGFQWGYGGSGPAQLALALLLDALRSVRAACDWYQQFKWQVVAKLADEWVLTQTDIEKWWRDAKPETEPMEESKRETEEENPGGLAEGTQSPHRNKVARNRLPVLETDHPRAE